MKSLDKLFKLADRFSHKISLAQQMEQEDIGTGESRTVIAAVGNKIKEIIAKKGLTDKVAAITFQGTINAPNFVTRNTNLEKIDVYAGLDVDPNRVQEANDEIMGLKTVVDAVLTKFYRTPEGIKILKNSGAPPNLIFSFKWKWK